MPLPRQCAAHTPTLFDLLWRTRISVEILLRLSFNLWNPSRTAPVLAHKRKHEETSDPTHQAPLQLLHSGGGLLKSLVGPRDSWEPTCPCPVAPIALDSCCPSDRPYLPFHALSPSETIPRHSRPTTLERKRQHRVGKPVKGKQNSPMRSIFPCLPAYRVLTC